MDHCHEKLLFRGWLHRKCNTALGVFGDNLDGLQQAVTYLERFKARTEETVIDDDHRY